MATIEIPKAKENSDSWPCYNDCPLGPLDCPLQIYVDDGTPSYPNYGHSEPGPDCPSPGVYRLVSEEKIEQFWKTIDGLPRLAAAHLDAINAAGLGRKEKA